MIAVPPVATQRWTRARFLTAIAAVFVLQIGLIFLLSDRSSATPRAPAAVPAIRVGDDLPPELLALEDPTVFVLPHRHGFSGEAWLKIPTQQFQPTNWWETPRWLPLSTQQLGAAFRKFVQTNAGTTFETIAVFEPEPVLPLGPPIEAIVIPSTVRIEGALANRPLLSEWNLPGWPITGTELLTNSLVQVQVGPLGNTVSCTLLSPGSGSRDADRRAVELARTARFEPANNGGPNGADPNGGWTSGTLVFEWQTLPMSQTNGTPNSP